jgi:hypothetical protein
MKDNLKHLPEFLKTRSGLFIARWGNMITVFILIFLSVKYQSPNIYFSLLVFSLSLIYIEVNFYINFNSLFEITYLKHDLNIFEEIKSVLKPIGAINYIRTVDFYGKFHLNSLDQLYEYSYVIEEAVDKKFQDAILEQMRKELSSSINEFTSAIALLTYPNGVTQSIPIEWRDSGDKELVNRFNQDAKRLNGLSKNLVENYDNLVKIASKKLYRD